jgi:hypothetical protein
VAFANIGKVLQYSSAVLGIPAAAAGTYSAYQTYFSDVGVCRQLRASIVSTMEQSVSAEAKRALLRKDVAAFDVKCGARDPDARDLFQSAMKSDIPTPAKADATAPATAPSTMLADAGSGAASTMPNVIVDVFGHSPAGKPNGWVALVRTISGQPGQPNFDGFALSLTVLPPAGTVLRAREMTPVWRQPQRGPNDQTQIQGRLAAGNCVRVLETQPAEGLQRTWGEVTPVACPATLPTAAN